MLPRAPFRPDDLAVVEHERRAGRAQGVDRRLDNRLQRLLEVERLGHGLGDPRQRLELVDPALRLRVELRVLDRLRDLGRDRQEQLDLGRAELARLPCPDVQRARELLPGQDGHREDRLVLVLGEVRERLEALVQVCLRWDHHGRPRLGRRPGDALPRAHPRAAGHLLDPRAVRRAQHELVGLLVVEVDEARVGLERLGHLAGNEREHLLEVERGIDRRARLGQEPKVATGFVHQPSVGAAYRRFTRSADCDCSRQVASGPMSVPASALLQTPGFLVADAHGRFVGRVECPMYGTQPDMPDALAVRRGLFGRGRRLVPADAIDQIDGSSGVVGLRVERDSLRSFL